MDWLIKPFDTLTPLELYQIIQLRQEVFVLEQQCIFQDLDNKDFQALHVMGRLNNTLAAYTRLLPAGVAYPTYASIGRVVTSPAIRSKGIGKALMLQSIEQFYLHFGEIPIKIGAQKYLLEFYSKLGFQISGPDYLEDGILHVEMIKPAP